MARYDFACTTYGPAIAAAILADDTATRAFGREEAFAQALALADTGFKSRLAQNTVTPDDMDRYIRPLFRAFATQADPSGVRKGNPWKYLHWACEAYLQTLKSTAPISAEDIYKIGENLADFEAFRQPGGDREALPVDRRDIHAYKSYGELVKTLLPYQHVRDARRAALVQIDDKIKQETTIVYDGPEGKIVIPHTKESCQFWGMQTKWCIAATKTKNYFDDYNAKAPIYIYLPVPSLLERQRLDQYSSFKFCGTNASVYDENDQLIDYKIPSLDRLITGARRALPQKTMLLSSEDFLIAEEFSRRLSDLVERFEKGRDSRPQLSQRVADLARAFALDSNTATVLPEAVQNALRDNGRIAKEMTDRLLYLCESTIDSRYENDDDVARIARKMTDINVFNAGSREHFELQGSFQKLERMEPLDGGLWDDKWELKEAFEKTTAALYLSDDGLRRDKGLLEELIQKIPDYLYGDMAQVISIVRLEMDDYKDLVFLAISRCSSYRVADLLNKASKEVYDDPRIVNMALDCCSYASDRKAVVKAAAGSVYRDPEILAKAIDICDTPVERNYVLQSAGRSVLDDDALVYKAMDKCRYVVSLASIFREASENVRSDRAFIMEVYRFADRYKKDIFNAAAENIRKEWFFRLKARLKWDKLFKLDRPSPDKKGAPAPQ